MYYIKKWQEGWALHKEGTKDYRLLNPEEILKVMNIFPDLKKEDVKMWSFDDIRILRGIKLEI